MIKIMTTRGVLVHKMYSNSDEKTQKRWPMNGRKQGFMIFFLNIEYYPVTNVVTGYSLKKYS